jgi:beta-propeller repeat-containing protein
MRRLYFIVLVLIVSGDCAAAQNDGGRTELEREQKGLSDLEKLPLSFAANLGQTDGRVKFLARGAGLSLFLTEDEAVVLLKKPGKQGGIKQASGRRSEFDRSESVAGSVVRMRLVGANSTAQAVGAAELPGKANYFIGNDPKKWRSNVPTYAQVKYSDVYPGIDLVYYGNQGELEYDFVVAPGKDPNVIGLRFQASGELHIDTNGDLVLPTQGVRFIKPQLYQEYKGVRRVIEGRYDLLAENTLHFLVGDYDRSKPLIIDPVLTYSTYLGGSIGDSAKGIAVDASQNAYVIGDTTSPDFPTVNAFIPIYPSQTQPPFTPSSIFITKIDPSGSALVFSTFLGGTDSDFSAGIAVDPAGNVYATGEARSTDFPTHNPIQPNRTECCSPDSGSSGFVTKLNPSGSALIYSTYLGGFGEDFATAIAADASGNAYITGSTEAPLLEGCPACFFPTTPGVVQPKPGGAVDESNNAFVTKINADGSALVFSTYLGGSGRDLGTAIAVDPSGNVYVTGSASSSDFPTAHALQSANKSSGGTAFVSKINPTGTAFVYSTYLGGSSGESGNGVAADKDGNAYLTGETSSADFPIVHPLQPTLSGGSDAFVTKINSSGSAIVYSTFLGGSGGENSAGIALDRLGNAYVTGSTSSTNFPTVDALQSSFAGGGTDAFVAQIDPTGSALVYSTYLGGSGGDGAAGVAVDPLGNVYVAGGTDSANFPILNAFQHLLGGSGVSNAFVSKIGSTITERLNLSGDEFSVGHPCMLDGHAATCGAHFVGWSGGTGHVANGWVAFPGDGKAVFEANVAYEGDVAFGKTVELVKGGKLELLLTPNKLLSEIVTEGTVTWPVSVYDDLGCGGGVAKVRALFTTTKDEPASFVGCLHDLPAGSVLPPTIWGTFFHIKGED